MPHRSYSGNMRKRFSVLCNSIMDLWHAKNSLKHQTLSAYDS